jgi:enoyl-CoA hydratase
MELALTGDPLTAEVAHHHGLVNRLVDPGTALDAALELAAAVAANGPLALAATKEILRRSLDWTEDEGWKQQADIMGPVFASEDAREGAAAFAEKRPPRWQGR